MPTVVVPVPAFPTVPQLPGVPPLARPAGDPTVLPTLVAVDAILGGFFGVVQWGIFTTGGAPALVADSVFAVEYARDYKISDYPQEQGAFQSYNKVRLPFQAKITYTLNRLRTEFLNTAEAITASLALFTVVTPEVIYPSANITHYSYRRDRAGSSTMVKVDVWCEEVRQTAQAFLAQSAQGTGGGSGVGTGGGSPTSTGTLSDTQSPNGAATQQGGSVQPTAQSNVVDLTAN